MKKILNLLQILKIKYGMFIGKKSLERLVAYIGGYEHCLIERGENISGLRMGFLPGFQEYIENRYNIHTDHHWSNIIQFFCNSDEEAFDTFYKLLDEFLAENYNQVEK